MRIASEHMQSALHPAGPEAAKIAEIGWVLFTGGTLIFLAVLVLAALALKSPRPWLRDHRLVVGGGIVFPVVVLSALLAYALFAAPRLSAAGPADVAIEVVGEQWWWRVNYLDGGGAREFATANELRVPVGATVEVRLRSADVLHSFWVPALAGKLDLVPGRENRLRFVAGRPGTYRGQCAEYCGGPHGLMAFHVIAESPERFAAWQASQRQPQQDTPAQATGRRLFLSHCASCHAVRGTPAEGGRGPDLTHLASRATLGAGILPNDRATLAAWIAANQTLKPGNLMPEFRAFSGEELDALAGYLRSLR